MLLDKHSKVLSSRPGTNVTLDDRSDALQDIGHRDLWASAVASSTFSTLHLLFQSSCSQSNLTRTLLTPGGRDDQIQHERQH